MQIDLGTSYRDSRRRLTDLVAEKAGEAKSIPVPCCPGWSVHDVVSHLVAVAEDATAGRLTGPPTDEQAAAQVARRSGVGTDRLLTDWEEQGPALEELLRQVPVWPALMDVLSHEHDVRQAIGRPGERDIPEITVCARRLVKGLVTGLDTGLDTGVDLAVTMDGEDFRQKEASTEEPDLQLETTAWEAFRFRLGRRSRAQLAQMKWTGNPSPLLDRLTIFGPNPDDVIE